MKNLKLIVVVVVTAVVAVACCCPCPTGNIPTGALPVSDRVMPRAPAAAPIAAVAPAIAQRF
ncbi:MAG: hypothetical protein HYS27_10185 [Deltaproteobacteria bacterium]|nr:hypothetical protein [Deltaproteobacteria bacterium]